MRIIVKNKETLLFDEFHFRCCVGKNGFNKNKKEGDNTTPKYLLYEKDLLELYYHPLFYFY